MTKPKKSTKKFVRKHLQSEIIRRRKTKGVRNRKKNQFQKISEALQEKNQVEGNTNVQDMSVDEFLGGGFMKISDTQQQPDEVEEESDVEDDNLSELDGDEDDDNDEEEEEQQPKTPKPRSPHPMKQDSETEFEVHKQQLELLKQKDPEFYAYLKQMDTELLAFNQQGNDQQSQEQEEMQQVKDKTSQKQSDKIITSELVDIWCSRLKNDTSLGSFRNLLKAFRAACRYNEGEEDDNNISIGSSAVYNRVVVFVLKQAPISFNTWLDGKLEQADKSPRWNKVKPMAQSFLTNTLHLLKELTDAPLIAFCLKHIRGCVPLLKFFDRLQQKYLQLCCRIFGKQEGIGPKVQAILVMREMSLKLDSPMLDKCMKGAYAAYSSNCGQFNVGSMQQIRFMGSCVVELFGLDMSVSYQYSFEYIKQLAILLRRAQTMKSKEGYREVYCWKYLNCLDVWVRIVSTYWDKGLEPLIHPVVQLLLGAVRLVSSPKYFPIRFRMVRALNYVSNAVGVYIPLSSLLLDVFQWSELHKPSSVGQVPAPDFRLQLKISKNVLKSTKVQQQVMEETLLLLAQHLAQWSYSIAFPELCHVPITLLKKFMKTSSVQRFKNSVKNLVDVIQKSATFVEAKRMQFNYGPCDIKQVEEFLKEEKSKQQSPLQKYVVNIQKQQDQNVAMQEATQIQFTSERNGVNKQQLKDDYPQNGFDNDVIQQYVESDDEDDEDEQEDDEEDDLAMIEEADLFQKQKRNQ
eukprot:TRINITY_DN6911_c0_g1_i1.p1 TRINITY_DN6911_c0_g1~~TRINITY_DN6911_c0_g1_i1.p1  ORF type:complete len:742 (-),score=101.51 TRINITY_DN6911_c0_g1_i1:287-2512(-)